MKEKYSQLSAKGDFCNLVAKKLNKHPDSIRNICNGYVKSTEKTNEIIEKYLNKQLILDQKIMQMTVNHYEIIK